MLKPKAYNLLMRCVEDGVLLGVNSAYKHTDNPTREQLCHSIENSIINEICEWFHFDDDTTI